MCDVVAVSLRSSIQRSQIDGLVVVIQWLGCTKARNDTRHTNVHFAKRCLEDSRTPVLDAAVASAVSTVAAFDVIRNDLILSNGPLHGNEQFATFTDRQTEIAGSCSIHGTLKRRESELIATSPDEHDQLTEFVELVLARLTGVSIDGPGCGNDHKSTADKLPRRRAAEVHESPSVDLS